MEKPLISIITRAFNRLEYTMLCIRNTFEKANDFNYEHIIVEQNSSDGTKEWLKSQEIEGFYPIKVIYNKTNTGDAGGMKDGFSIAKGKYIIQLDNDLIPETDNFLEKIYDILESDYTIGSIMLKRDGVGHHINCHKPCEIINTIKLCTPDRPYGIVFRKDILDILNHWKTGKNIGWVFSITSLIQQKGFKVYKTKDIRLLHIDGHYSVAKYEQKHRYKYYFGSILKGSNYKNIKYE